MLVCLLLHRIHKGFLDFVEDEDADEHEDCHEGKTVVQGSPREVALAKGDKLESLDG